MSYRDDLAAALARADSLERELAILRGEHAPSPPPPPSAPLPSFDAGTPNRQGGSMFACHSALEMIYLLWGSFTIGAGWAVGRWAVGKVLK